MEHKGTHVQYQESVKMEIKSEAKKPEGTNESVKNGNLRIGNAEINNYRTTAETNTPFKVSEERCSNSESEHFASSKTDGHFAPNSEMKRKVRRNKRIKPHKDDENPLKKQSSAKQHRKTASKRLRCDECGQKFSRETKLQKHLALLDKMNVQDGASQYCTINEEGGKSYKCSDCDESFDSKCKFQAHLRISKEWRLFQCPHCNRLFSLAHCNIQDLMCPLCGNNAANLVDFKTRIFNQAKQKSYQCETCNKSFEGKSELIRHVWTHADRKPHQCPHCDKSFVERPKLNEHIRTHTGKKPYQCSICGRTFAQKLGLDCHVRTHIGEKPFQCTDCGRSFADKSNLKNHLLSHTGERLHKCAECGKAFGTGSRLKRHMRIHTEEKPYQCSECGKAFTLSKSLGTHMTVHTGERRHKCVVCNKSFSQKSALNTHMLRHTGEKPHECSQCGKRFVQRPHLKKHLKFSCPSTKTKGAEIFSCFVCRVLFTDPTREGMDSKVPKREMCTKCCDALRRGETLDDLYQRSNTQKLPKTSLTIRTSPSNHGKIDGVKGKSDESGMSSGIQSKLSGTSEDDVNENSENDGYESEDWMDDINLNVQTPNRDNHNSRFIPDENHTESLVDKRKKRQSCNGDNFQKNLGRSVSGEKKLVLNSVNFNTQITKGQPIRDVHNLEVTMPTDCAPIRNKEHDSDDDSDGIADFPFSASDLENICEEDYDSDKTIDIDLSDRNDSFTTLNSTADNVGKNTFEGTKSGEATEINASRSINADVIGKSGVSPTDRSISQKSNEELVSGSDGDGSDSDRTIDMTFSDDEVDAVEGISGNTEKNIKRRRPTRVRKSVKSATEKRKNKNVVLYQCLKCNKMFSFVRNQKEQSESKIICCPRCETSIEEAEDFENQLRKLKKEKSFKCAECDKDCGRKTKLLRHVWRHCDTKPFQCHQCDMSFVENSKLMSHMRKHTGEKPYQCDLCDKTFTQKVSLDHHTRLHKGEKPYQCSTCGSAFTDMSSLRNHMLVHSNEKSHQCTECGKAFGTGAKLKRHMRVHTGEKPYQCKLCENAFTRSETLRIHMIVHTGERKYKCDVCNKTFTQKSALNTHKLIHTGEKRHECIQCGKRFVQKAHLQKHLKFSCPSK